MARAGLKNLIGRWIKSELRESKARGIVFGLSGGIDSSVVAALLKEALGAKRVLALLLPCHSHPGDSEDAMRVARQLGLQTKTIDLTKPYDALVSILPPGRKLALANLRPRLRMMVLYYFANKLNYLVCGTGNKSELMAGYFTKYGDGGVDILPLADVYKKEVRRLAEELHIPKRIIDKPPTAGLWPGQTDEGEMGIMYDELDDILQRIARRHRQAQPQAKVRIVKDKIKASEHKRQLPKIFHV